MSGHVRLEPHQLFHWLFCIFFSKIQQLYLLCTRAHCDNFIILRVFLYKCLGMMIFIVCKLLIWWDKLMQELVDDVFTKTPVGKSVARVMRLCRHVCVCRLGSFQSQESFTFAMLGCFNKNSVCVRSEKWRLLRFSLSH